MGAFGVVDAVERVDLGLQLIEAVGEGLFVEPAEQGLVEAFVLALRGRFVGFAGDRVDPEPGDVGDELPEARRDGTGSTPPRCR